MKEQAARIKSIHQEEEFFVAIDSNLGAAVGGQEGAVMSIPGNEGRIAQVWVNEGCECLQHTSGTRRDGSQEMKPSWKRCAKEPEVLMLRNEASVEAVVKQVRTTRRPWLMACYANMSPEDFQKSLRFRKDQMHVIAPEGVSTCRSKNAKGECVEKVYDYVIACNSLKGKISQMNVVEDVESRPHKAVTFVVERGKGRQEWNEQKLPKALSGYSGGRRG